MPRGESGGSDVNLYQMLQQAGFSGQGLNIAYGVMMAESGGNPFAHNGNAGTGDNSYGLFQINMLGGMGPERLRQYGLRSNDDLFDIATNIRVAYKMSKGGTDWSPWSTFKSGAYSKYAHDGNSHNVTIQGGVATSWQPPAAVGADFVEAPTIKDFAPEDARMTQAPGSMTKPTTTQNVATAAANGLRQRIIAAAMAQLGTPYSWGGGSKDGATYGIERGAGTLGFDCSGLMLYAFGQAGYNMPRLSWDQLKRGERVAVSDLQPGDLVGFGSGGHVALYIGNNQILEAPRTGLNVRVRSLGSGSNAWGVHLNLPGD